MLSRLGCCGILPLVLSRREPLTLWKSCLRTTIRSNVVTPCGRSWSGRNYPCSSGRRRPACQSPASGIFSRKDRVPWRRTYERLASAATILLRRPVTSAELRGESKSQLGCPLRQFGLSGAPGRLRAPRPTVNDLADFSISQTVRGWALRPPGGPSELYCFETANGHNGTVEKRIGSRLL